MSRLVVSFFSGLVFAVGLGLSGMTDPTKVLGFLDFFGNWDPSLACVMGSALGINFFAFRAVQRRAVPVLDTKLHLPQPKLVDARLIGGSAIFGAGWGLSGFCPGAAVAAIPTAASTVLIFMLSMTAGLVLFRAVDALRAVRPQERPERPLETAPA